MASIDEIRAQVARISPRESKRLKHSIRALEEILNNGERIENIATCIFLSNTGALFGTNHQLRFIGFGLGFTNPLHTDGIQYKEIEKIDTSRGLFKGRIEISTPSRRLRFISVPNSRVKDFARWLREKVDDANAEIMQKNLEKGDVVGKLENLHSLHLQGILTEEEYLEQRNRLLNQDS